MGDSGVNDYCLRRGGVQKSKEGHGLLMQLQHAVFSAFVYVHVVYIRNTKRIYNQAVVNKTTSAYMSSLVFAYLHVNRPKTFVFHRSITLLNNGKGSGGVATAVAKADEALHVRICRAVHVHTTKCGVFCTD